MRKALLVFASAVIPLLVILFAIILLAGQWNGVTGDVGVRTLCDRFSSAVEGGADERGAAQELAAGLESFMDGRLYYMYSVQYPELASAVQEMRDAACVADIRNVAVAQAAYYAGLNDRLQDTQGILFALSTALTLIVLAGSVSLVYYERIVHEKRTMRLILDGIESERTYLSMELHDSVIQDIKAAERLSSSLSDFLPPGGEGLSSLQRLGGVLDSAQRKARKLCTSLNPPGMDFSTLELTLKQFCLEFERQSGIHVGFYIVGSDVFVSLRTDKERLHVFRIVQEALSNARDHSHANQINVSARRSGKKKGGFVLFISDDGHGFDSDGALLREKSSGSGDERHFGLLDIEQRVRLLDGSLRISSTEEGGTELRIEI